MCHLNWIFLSHVNLASITIIADICTRGDEAIHDIKLWSRTSHDSDVADFTSFVAWLQEIRDGGFSLPVTLFLRCFPMDSCNFIHGLQNHGLQQDFGRSWVMPVFINASEDCDTPLSWHGHYLHVSPGRSLAKSDRPAHRLREIFFGRQLRVIFHYFPKGKRHQ